MLRHEAQIAHENNEFNPLSQVFNMILFREKVMTVAIGSWWLPRLI